MPDHPVLKQLSLEHWHQLQRQADHLTLAPGDEVFQAGEACKGLPLVIHGCVRVQINGASGNRIVLYRIGDEDLCTLSVGCLLNTAVYRAEAFVEKTTEVILVPKSLFRELMNQSAAFRDAVLHSYTQRLNDLLLLVEEVAFRRMDQRLLDWLDGHHDHGEIRMTHQAIAEELGTAREVVSRLLKDLERAGRVRLGRGLIELTSASGQEG